MDVVGVVHQVIALLCQRGRVAYRTLTVQFHGDDAARAALKDELRYAQQVARDEDDRILVWVGDAVPPAPPPSSALPPSPSAPSLDALHTALHGANRPTPLASRSSPLPS